jgi:hypothetical protein
MSAKPTTHPSVEELRTFSLGKADSTAGETVAAHLATCSDCRKIVASLSGDSFSDRLKKAQPAAASTPSHGPTGTSADSILDAPAAIRPSSQ